MSNHPRRFHDGRDDWNENNSQHFDRLRCHSAGYSTVGNIGNAAFAPGFHPPPSQFESVVARPSQRRQSKKSKTHRKKHVPPGPAGVWFQTQQQQQQHCERKRNGNSDDEEELLCTQVDNKSNRQQQHPKNNCTSFYNPAWTSMQCALGFATPNCPPWLSTAQRYALVRPHVPDRFVLIRDIGGIGMQNIWKLPSDRKMLVLVHTIHAAMGDHCLWTVCLTDETGSSMQAWIKPSFVQQEQQRTVPQYLRLGVVWMLSNVTLMLLANASERNGRSTFHFGVGSSENDDEDEEYEVDDEDGFHHEGFQRGKGLERMVLISESSIEQVWTPAMEKDISNEAYIQWMEQRQTATLLIESGEAKNQPDSEAHEEFINPSFAGNQNLRDKKTSSCSSSSTEEREFSDEVEITEYSSIEQEKMKQDCPKHGTMTHLLEQSVDKGLQIQYSWIEPQSLKLSSRTPPTHEALVPSPPLRSITDCHDPELSVVSPSFHVIRENQIDSRTRSPYSLSENNIGISCTLESRKNRPVDENFAIRTICAEQSPAEKRQLSLTFNKSAVPHICIDPVTNSPEKRSQSSQDEVLTERSLTNIICARQTIHSLLSAEKENVHSSNESDSSIVKSKRARMDKAGTTARRTETTSSCSKASNLWTCTDIALMNMFDEDDDDGPRKCCSDALIESSSREIDRLIPKGSTTKNIDSHPDDASDNESLDNACIKDYVKSKPQGSNLWTVGSVNIEDFLSDEDS